MKRIVVFILMMAMSFTVSAQDAKIIYDTTVTSSAQSFSITIPGRLLDFSATERTPNNITMTNNWDILQADGTLAVNEGDILLVVDYFESASEMNLPEDSTVLDVANAMVERSTRETSPPLESVAGDYDGYLYISTIDGLIFTSGMFDIGEGAFAGFTLLTVADDSANQLLDTALTIVGSLQKGLVIGHVEALDLKLPNTYTREEDGFNIPYPKGWTVQISPLGRSQFVTVTKGHTFDINIPTSPGQPVAIIAYGTIDELTEMPMTMIDPEMNAQRVIQAIIGATPDEIVHLEIAGFRAAQTVRNNPDFENWFIAIMLDDNHFISANMFTDIDADVDFFGIITEMIIHARWGEDLPSYDYASGTELDSDLQTFISEFHNLSFDIPTDWFAYDLSDEISVVINTEDAFDSVTEQLPPESGEVLITIFTHTTINAFGNGDIDVMLQNLNQTMFTDGIGNLTESELNGRTVYVAENDFAQFERWAILTPVDDDYVLMLIEAPVGELDGMRETITAILESMFIK